MVKFYLSLAPTIFLAALTTQATQPSVQPTSTRRPSPINKCAAQPDVLHSMFVPLAHLRHFDSAEIILNNNGTDALVAKPTWYLDGRRPIRGKDVSLSPQTMRFVRFEELLPSGLNLNTIAGLLVEYEGKMMELGGQVVLYRKTGFGGDNVDVPFSMGMDFKSSRLEGAWKVTKQDASMLALTNVTAAPLDVYVDSAAERGGAIRLKPYQSRLIRLEHPEHSAHSGFAQWVALRSSGEPGALRATGVISSPKQHSRLIRLYDPDASQQPHLFATLMRTRNVIGDITLKNTSDLQITALPTFLDPDTGQVVFEMESLTLAPGAAQSLSLEKAVEVLARTNKLQEVGVRVESDGPNGALIGSIYLDDLATGIPFDVPLRDSGPARKSTGSYPWRLDGDYETVVSITNAGLITATFVARVFHAGGELVFSPRALAPGASARIDLKALRNEHVKDQNGQTLPLTATSGRFMWSVLGGGQAARLVGRAEIVSKSAGVSSSYSCGQCCPDSFRWGLVTPGSQSLVVDSTNSYTITGQYENCYNSGYSLNVWPWWNVQYSNVASIYTENWGLGRVSGNDAGDSDLWALWDVEEWTPYFDDCIVDSWTNESIAAVQVKVPTSLSVVSETYTDPPPPPYAKRLVYQILDQNGQPMNGYAPGLYVTETYTPNPASGNCTSSTITTGSGYADANGRFTDDYTLGAGAPDPCSSTSTQKHSVNGRQVSTKTVNWTYSGVTVK